MSLYSKKLLHLDFSEFHHSGIHPTCKGVFIFSPAYPAGCILTRVRNIYPVFRPGYETFCKLAFGGTKHFFNISTFSIHKRMGVRNIFGDGGQGCETFRPTTEGGTKHFCVVRKNAPSRLCRVNNEHPLYDLFTLYGDDF